MFSKKPEPSYPSPAPRPVVKPVANGGSTFSVLGADVAIKGNVEASADLHVDGVVEGDIACTSLVQGESSRIEGSITADGARLSGTIKGSITVRELVILKSARIDGDVHYETLTIEQGANVNGRFAPDAGKAAKPAMPAAAAPKPQGPVLELGKDEEQQRVTLAS
jgi:cytoskeletal protein CcmA (bactofilin family)